MGDVRTLVGRERERTAWKVCFSYAKTLPYMVTELFSEGLWSIQGEVEHESFLSGGMDVESKCVVEGLNDVTK